MTNLITSHQQIDGWIETSKRINGEVHKTIKASAVSPMLTKLVYRKVTNIEHEEGAHRKGLDQMHTIMFDYMSEKWRTIRWPDGVWELSVLCEDEDGDLHWMITHTFDIKWYNLQIYNLHYTDQLIDDVPDGKRAKCVHDLFMACAYVIRLAKLQPMDPFETILTQEGG